MIHFYLIFVNGESVRVQFSPFAYWHPVIPAPFKKTIPSPLNSCLSFYRLLQQNTINWMAYKHKIFALPQLQRLGNPRVWHWQIWCLVKFHFLDGHLFTISHMAEKQGASCSLFYKALISCMSTLLSWLNDSPKLHLLVALWGLGCQYIDFKRTQSFRP